MSGLRERIDDFIWTQVMGDAESINQEEFDTWAFFILKNNILERNYQFDIDFNRIAKEELN